jgi:membrane-associated phospholipid phosphatase
MTFEINLIKWLQSIRSDILDFIFEFFTVFGEELVVIAVLGFVYWAIDKKTGEKLGITVFISLGFNALLKLIIMRPRPFMVDDSIINLRPETSGGYSMPSGHTQSASTVFFGLYQFLKKRYLMIIAIIITILVAISRMYIGVHYLTDVLVGGILGFLITYYMYRWISKKSDLKTLYNVILAISFIVLVSIFIYNYITLSKTNFDSQQFYFNTEAIAKMIGTLVGFIVGVKIEAKYIKFENHRILYKNLIRFALGVGVVFLSRIALKELFHLFVNSEDLALDQYFMAGFASFLDFLRYAIMVIVGIGIYPILFKKINI